MKQYMTCRIVADMPNYRVHRTPDYINPSVAIADVADWLERNMPRIEGAEIELTVSLAYTGAPK